jgi:hypothetical protein
MLSNDPIWAQSRASDAIVAMVPHHHLLEEMRPLLRAEAKRLGLKRAGRLSGDQSPLFSESR